MGTIGLDLHKRESQLSSKAADGTLTERRIVTSRERFTVSAATGRAYRFHSASAESEWADGGAFRLRIFPSVPAAAG